MHSLYCPNNYFMTHLSLLYLEPRRGRTRCFAFPSCYCCCLSHIPLPSLLIYVLLFLSLWSCLFPFPPIPSKWHLPLLLFLPFHFFFSTSFSDFSFSFPLPTSFFPFSLPHAVPSFHFPFHLLPHLYFFSLLLFTYHGLGSWPLSRIKQSAWEIREVHDLLSLPLSLLLSFPHVTFNYSLWYTNHYSAFLQTQRADS